MLFLDLSAQYKTIKKEIDGAIRRVLDSGIFVGGEEVENFENEMAAFCGAKHAVGVNSGTDSLFLALKALDIGPGDEIITTPFTFIATAGVIINCGAKPVFADVNPKTFNIDPEKIKGKITKKTKAIIPVHVFGQMADMDEIMAIARKNNLYVIEDSAQAIGAEYKGRKAGTVGDLGCFSFFPSKNLGAYGDGGMVITDDEKLARRIRLLKSHGSSSKEKYLNLVIGTNSRLDAMQAAILRVKLRYLSGWNKERLQKALNYSGKLNGTGDIVTPVIGQGRNHIFHQYTVRTGLRDGLREYLKEKGIPSMAYYPLPLHLQPALKYLGYKAGDFPEAEKIAGEVLSLPIYPELENREQDFVAGTIKDFFKN